MFWLNSSVFPPSWLHSRMANQAVGVPTVPVSTLVMAGSLVAVSSAVGATPTPGGEAESAFPIWRRSRFVMGGLLIVLRLVLVSPPAGCVRAAANRCQHHAGIVSGPNRLFSPSRGESASAEPRKAVQRVACGKTTGLWNRWRRAWLVYSVRTYPPPPTKCLLVPCARSRSGLCARWHNPACCGEFER